MYIFFLQTTSNIFSRAKLSPDDPYASNWLERLRHIKRLKAKVLKDLTEDEESSGAIHDFTSKIFILHQKGKGGHNPLFCRLRVKVLVSAIRGRQRDGGDKSKYV